MYINYCHEKFGGKNGAEMFDKLEEIICEFMESNEGAKISFQHHNKDRKSVLKQSNGDSTYERSIFDDNW